MFIKLVTIFALVFISLYLFYSMWSILLKSKKKQKVLYPTKQVIVMRKDLNMRRGKEMTQASHASMRFLLDNFYSKPGAVVQHFLSDEQQAWFLTGTKKVVVGCSSESELKEIYDKAVAAGLTVNMVIDRGFTEFHGVETKTCIAIGPHYNEKIDPLTSHLKLL